MNWLSPAPRYDGGGLAGVLPAVAASLGIQSSVPSIASVGVPAGAPPDQGSLRLPQTRRAVVVLVDGMGLQLLRRRAGHAPFLSTLLPSARELTAGFPSTTATSMGTFGTGCAPGRHGLVGYEVLIPYEDRLLNELNWHNGPDSLTWQRQPTVFEQVAAAGVATFHVARPLFDGSGLTLAALRGATFVPADDLTAAVDATAAVLRRCDRGLVFLYWPELDKVGHQDGCESWQWGEELSAIDAQMRRLAGAVPKGTQVYLTADHGMVDIPFVDRVDLADEAHLQAGVRHVGGEARARYLYCEPDATESVRRAWQDRFGDQVELRTRQEAVSAGWFGPLEQHVAPRIGDLVVAMRADIAVVDSRRESPRLLSLLGLHGSLTRDEALVPLLSASGG